MKESKSLVRIDHIYSLSTLWLEELAAMLGGEVIQNNLLHIPKQLGEGLVFTHQILPEMHVVLFDLVLSKSILFTRKPVEEDFWILYYDLSDYNNIHIVDNIKHKVGDNSLLDFAILDSKVESSYMSKAYNREFSMRILIGKSFVLSSLKERGLDEKFMEIITKKQNFFYGSIDSKSKALLYELKKQRVDSPHYELLLTGIIYNLLAYFLERQSSLMIETSVITERDRMAVIKSHEYLLSDLTIPFLGLDALVEVAHMSVSKYRKLYKQIYGTTPVNFFRNEKMLLAQTMVESGNYKSISEIAFALGYVNVDYFSRSYKKHFGVFLSDIL
ncbi:helix-turn-helix transcriptional regulator [Flavobacterium sp. HSC-61S13]|uniref:helix-turn-helix transcriptional regulator n=1 Tax=Flavobacterium sp. HSC-61S13 TaxID=2910963 RepID=UPI00209FC583|nr:helix-turn-helix transcriptional regulator [Flavobacterium sp. HSC-61S13]MCP1997467.1 AraC-like DNA-binding protein [Flavobacterium sp. HSC-61S13]